MTTIEVNVLEELLGQVLVKVEKSCEDAQDTLQFWLADGRIYDFSHDQNCCECVEIESIVGDLDDLVGSPLLMAEEVTGEMEDVESGTWTFYKFATVKGYVDVRWTGTSNGYYSESVNRGFIRKTHSIKLLDT